MTCNQIELGPMRLKSIVLSLLACVSLALAAQPTQQATEWEWYLDEVVSETFVGRNYFEYYYSPSAADMEQQRAKGEVSYFLNSPAGLNSKKVRDKIDQLMASYDGIKATGEWHMTTGTYWKEFRYEKNKFRFSVKRKALDDGTYYVSVTETADYYKSLSKKNKTQDKEQSSQPSKRSTRNSRKQITVDETDNEVSPDIQAALDDESQDNTPVMSEKQRRQEAREKKEAEEMAERARLRRAQEKRREEAKAQKEAEKLKKEEEKQKKEEEKRLKKEEEKQRREQARKEREQQRREQAESRKQATSSKTTSSKYHFDDVALWLSEKYDFTQTSGSESSCTMYSTAVKDAEMAKLAIKNALKGSNARMAVPWRLNSETQALETGYTVDGHVLVFAIGKNDDGNITLTVTEVSDEDFNAFKQSLKNQ